MWSESDTAESEEVKSSIQRNRELKLQTGAQYNVEADADLVQRAIKFFERHLQLVMGNYRVDIEVVSVSDQTLAIKSFDFTIYEYQMQQLREPLNQYALGNFGDFSPGVWLRLRPAILQR